MHKLLRINTLKILLLGLFFSLQAIVLAQTNISGVINQYIDVTGYNAGTNSVTVSSAAGFSIGDQVLLIQMQGATISETDDANFGTITNYNDCGNYEILIICDIVGNEITFDQTFLNTYTPSGVVQLISMPVYSSATISGGDLTCAPWNGTTGGVLVFEVTGALDFGAQDIDVSGLGFRGPDPLITDGGCSFILDATYYQPATNNDVYSWKGEGIALYITGKETGRGPQANGGGGGNNHNGGGGGGGNYGYGGSGGRRIKSSNFTCGSEGGVNSKSLSTGYAMNKIFMGGGGGAGNGNNVSYLAENGEDGAGIVIIRAGSIAGNNRSILADGNTVNGNADSDGAGGGGAGGTVLLEVGNYTSNLTVSVTGGDGADTDNAGTSNCNGPGGGGGGGLVWASGGAFPVSVTTVLTPGSAGIINTTTQSNCTVGSNNLATNGQVGGTLTNLVLNESSTPYVGCSLPLPASVISLSGKIVDQQVELHWQTITELNNAYFTVEHSSNGNDFTPLGKIDGAGTTLLPKNYHFVDPYPLRGWNYYRLLQTDFDGKTTEVGQIAVDLTAGLSDLIIYPNPVGDKATIECQSKQDALGDFEIYSIQGKAINHFSAQLQKGTNNISFNTFDLSSGTYLVVIRMNDEIFRVKFIK